MNRKTTQDLAAHRRTPPLRGRVAALLAAALIAAAPTLGACSAAPSAPAEGQQPASGQPQASVSVTQRVGDGEKAVEVPDGSTVLDVLKASGVEFESSDGSYGAYVTSIDGKAAEGNSGWTYSVNGEQPTVGCGEYEVADGDVVTWEYVSF